MPQLVVFDFDWSMVDQDTDGYVFEVLALDLRRYIQTVEYEIEWTDLIAQCLRTLHSRGVTRDQIEDALKGLPFHPAMIRAISHLGQTGTTTFLCLSSSNQVFIETILKAKRLDDLFQEIITNPAEWDESGLLKLRRRIDPAGPQHKCKVGCAPNMCKGEELSAFLDRQSCKYDRVVYVGDGANDFCPILRLRSHDKVLCRTHRGLQKCIAKEGEKRGLQAQVQYWSGAWEVEEIFNTLGKSEDVSK